MAPQDWCGGDSVGGGGYLGQRGGIGKAAVPAGGAARLLLRLAFEEGAEPPAPLADE